MKKIFLTILLLGMVSLCAFAQAVTLDKAIKNSADEIGGRLTTGTKIAVTNFKSTSQVLSAYVIEELNNALVNDGRLQVQSRNPEVMEKAREEIEFNDSEEVSDKSAQQIGRMLGAQTFVNGSMERVGKDAYRLRIQVLEVETLTMRYSKNIDVQNDRRIKLLMAGSTTTYVEDYTAGERTGTAALNLLFGIGSLTQKDIVAGGIVTGVIESVGVVLFIVGISGRSDDLELLEGRHDSFEVISLTEDTKKRIEKDIKSDEALMFAGVGVYAAGAVWGAIRAFTVHKPGYIASIAEPFNIALVSDQRGNAALQLSYTFKY